jgi:retinol dehydrogenase-12
MLQPGASMRGKVCMVTGATSGMGAVTAHALAQKGAIVVVAGRSREKGEACIERIRRESGNPAVEFLRADLSSQQEIRALVREFQSRYERLDVLVNNAGALFLRRQTSVDGIEMTFALNHLGYFLLTNLLLDTLKASAPARIINISSLGHRGVHVDFDDLQACRHYNGLQVYRQSKLANLLFTYELAGRLAGTGVTVNAVNPGYVATNFALNNFPLGDGWVGSVARGLYGLIAASPEQGARTAVYLATAPDVEGVTGKYFENGRQSRSSPDSHDREAAGQLWQASENMLQLAKGRTS